MGEGESGGGGGGTAWAGQAAGGGWVAGLKEKNAQSLADRIKTKRMKSPNKLEYCTLQVNMMEFSQNIPFLMLTITNQNYKRMLEEAGKILQAYCRA